MFGLNRYQAKQKLAEMPIGSRITDDHGIEWEKLDDGKWWKLELAYHYDDDRNQILDVVGGKQVQR